MQDHGAATIRATRRRAAAGIRWHRPENTKKAGTIPGGPPTRHRVMEPLLLRAAIKRGFVVVAANWPIVLIDFAVESVARLALILPVVGGALLVTVVAGSDVRALFAGGVIEAADIVVGSLTSAPGALVAFLAAVALVAVGGEAVQFIVKAGTLSVIARADAVAGEVQRFPIDAESLRRARAFRLEILIDAGRRFARRGIVLSLWLGLVYAVVVLFYLVFVTEGMAVVQSAWMPAWSAIMLGATSTAVVAIAMANLAYTLLRVVIVTDDCGIGTAAGRLLRFAIEDARQVMGVFAVIGGIELAAAALALLVAAALTPIAYLPFVGLLVVPLQAAIWLVRALVFEALSLSSVAAYQTQYRRFGQSRWGAGAEVSVASETDEAPEIDPRE